MDKTGTGGQGFLRKGLWGTNKAQMAVIFLVLILIGLFFLGVVANWNKMATSRTNVTMASNLGASTLTSYIASYGEAHINQELLGQRKRCQWDGLGVILTTGLAIALFVCLSPFLGVLAIVAMAAAVSSTAVQGVAVAPTTSTIWNVLVDPKMAIEDRFVEAGIGATMPLAVSDSVMVQDDHDFLMKGLTPVATATTSASIPVNNINRFAYLYSMRVWNRKVPQDASAPSPKPFENFQKALKTMASNLGFTDVKCSPPAVGDPCCVPLEYRTPLEDCKKDPPESEQQNACERLIKYDDGNFREWPYDDGYCDGIKPGTFLNFIGVDDGNQNFKMDKPNTLGSPQSRYDFKYLGWDSVSDSSNQGDVFSLLWELHDSYIDISNAQPGTPPSTSPKCHWWDRTEHGDPACEQKDLYKFPSKLLELAVLPGCAELQEKKTCFVEHPNSNGFLDKVKTVEPYLKDPEPPVCPQDPMTVYGMDSSSIMGCRKTIPNNCALKNLQVVWRAGWDANGNKWPYWGDESDINTAAPCFAGSGIPDDQEPFSSNPGNADSLQCSPVLDDTYFKHPCGCNELAKHADQWHSDTFDDMAVRLRQMNREMAAVVAMTPATVNREMAWSQAVEWVTYLRKMSCDLRAYREIYNLWLKDNYKDEKGDDTWCVPQQFPPKDMDISEKEAIEAAAENGETNPCPKSGENGKMGNLASVTGCMDFQANESTQAKWQPCIDNCQAVIQDPSKCHITKEGEETVYCGKCDWIPGIAVGHECFKMCHYDKDGNLKSEEEPNCNEFVVKVKVYDIPEAGCVDPKDTPWDKNYGKKPEDCHDLPRSFYAHETGNWGQTMQKNFEEDSCCNSLPMKPPFSSARYKTDPNNPDDKKIPDFDKCAEWLQTSPLPYEEQPCDPEGPPHGEKPTKHWKKEAAPPDERRECNMCSRVWKLDDDLNPKGLMAPPPDKHVLKVWENTLTRVSNMFKQMTINRHKQRSEYLNLVQEKIKKALDPFTNMADKIDADLPAFEQTVSALCEQIKKDNGPEKAYYVWRNQGDPKDPKSNPTWHAVMVEAGIPSRCNGACFSSKIPWVRQYVGDWGWKGIKHCWNLQNSKGMVYIKVSRYDEERDPLSVVSGVVTQQPKEPLTACGSSPRNLEDEAFISCNDPEHPNNCSDFKGMLKGGCLTAAQQVIASKGHTVMTQGEYWVTRDPRRTRRDMYNLKIRQK